MEFQKYQSLVNTYQEKVVNLCQMLGVVDWVALEKIDGANMSFIEDYGDVKVATRNGVIEREPTGVFSFYGSTEVIDKTIPMVVELAELIGGPIRVIGEFYGSGVQKRLNYGEKAFRVFDIQVLDDSFIPWDSVVALSAQVGLKTAPEIARGTLEELLALSPEFTSKLCSDPSEGLVIKPLTEGTLLGNGTRPILKQKSKAFSEKSHKPKKPKKSLSEEAAKFFMTLSVYITENRLENVLSKFGEPTQKDFGTLVKLLVQDAKEEYLQEGGTIEGTLWKETIREINNTAMTVVRKKLFT